MFYHLILEVIEMGEWIIINKSLDELIQEYICPFIQNEITLHEGKIFSMASYSSLRIALTDSPIDSEWPVKKSDFIDEDKLINRLKYQDKLINYLLNTKDSTKELYKEALIRITDGSYQEIRKTYLNDLMGKNVFFICPFGDKTIDHNFSYAIKPTVLEFGYVINRVDEIPHTNQVTDKIIEGIKKARFIIADLSNERPNCYYEIGYAHALQKPVIIIAREGTPRHFDISTYKWIYWKSYKDLKTKLRPEVETIIKSFQ
jgi:hypothetical protein